jgi:GTPase SAR1 family protein
MLPLYVRGAHIIVGVYDVTDPESIHRVMENWERFRPEGGQPKWIMVGNKVDVPEMAPCVVAHMREFCEREGVSHLLVSARDGQGMDELLTQLMASATADTCAESTADDDVIRVTHKVEKQAWGKCCQ